MKWRVEPGDKPGAWYSKFKLFAPEDDKNSVLVTALQQPVDFRPSTLKKWWKKRNTQHERFMQQFIPERHEILGNDLAAAHFLVHRGGSVRFFGEEKWIKSDKYGEYDLPGKFVPSMVLEAIKCDNMELYYEGLENVRRLKYLKYLSFKNVEPFDDWCLDRVSGSEFEALETLDLSGTNITEKGLQALYRIPSLKTLIVDDPHRNKAWELVLAMLEEINHKLEVISSKNA
jgi:hypothetical protein